MPFARLREQTVVCEGRHIDRTEHRQHGIAGIAGYGETMIETAAACPGGGNHEAIEYNPIAFVAVEAIANEFTEESSALRITVSEDVLQRAGIFPQCRAAWTISEIRSEIANRRQSEPGDGRPFGLVNDFVNTGLETSLQIHRA